MARSSIFSAPAKSPVLRRVMASCTRVAAGEYVGSFPVCFRLVLGRVFRSPPAIRLKSSLSFSRERDASFSPNSSPGTRLLPFAQERMAGDWLYKNDLEPHGYDEFMATRSLRAAWCRAKVSYRRKGYAFGSWLVSQPPPRALIKATLASIRRRSKSTSVRSFVSAMVWAVITSR